MSEQAGVRPTLISRGIGGALCACMLAACVAGCAQTPVPDYTSSIHLPHSPGSAQPVQPLDRKEPFVAVLQVTKGNPSAPPLEIPSEWSKDGVKLFDPWTFTVSDPDGLVYRWRRQLSTDEIPVALERRMIGVDSASFRFDLGRWAPKDYHWETGAYRISGFARAGGRYVTAGPSTFYVEAMPPDPRAEPEQMLQAVLETNRTQFERGEQIVLRGYLQNVGDRAFMVQTGQPFREARLVGEPGWVMFPKRPSDQPLILEDFRRLGPGERIPLFEKTFTAGEVVPGWKLRYHLEWMPAPFVSPRTDVTFRLHSRGLFPQDELPQLGVWSGSAVSNPVRIIVERR